MTTTTIPVDANDLASLREHGDRIELADGRTLRLVIEPDTDTSIMDEQGEGMWCGVLAWDDRRNVNECGYRKRPDGMTGRAEVIHRDGSDRLWWQVPADVELGSDNYRSLRRSILDLLECGYVQAGLVLECEHGGELDAAWVGGCDSFYPGLVTDLAADIDWSRS